MKINRLLLGFVLFLLSVSLVSAGMFPEPVSGTVKLPGYSTLEGLSLEQKNLRTGEVVKTTLDSNGFYMVDWANHPYRDGDKVLISISVCKDRAVCNAEVTLYDGHPVKKDFIVPASFQVYYDENQIYVCPDGIEVEDKGDCIAVIKGDKVLVDPGTGDKQVLDTEYVCSNGDKVEDPADCPSGPLVFVVSLLSGLLVIVAGVLAKFSWGKGFVGLANYWKRKGDEAKKANDYDLAYKHYMRAAKMLGTAMRKEKEKLYVKADKL